MLLIARGMRRPPSIHPSVPTANQPSPIHWGIVLSINKVYCGLSWPPPAVHRHFYEFRKPPAELFLLPSIPAHKAPVQVNSHKSNLSSGGRSVGRCRHPDRDNNNNENNNAPVPWPVVVVAMEVLPQRSRNTYLCIIGGRTIGGQHSE